MMDNLTSPYLVLGLDLGIGSCGFALIDLNNHRILEMGSHLFDIPQNPKDHTSLAVVRRNARHVRRNTKRKRDRQKHCLNLLTKHGLVPAGSNKEWLQSRKGDKPLLKLRAVGLDKLLTDREFSQILYVLSSRRGYIPHGEGSISSVDDAESKKVLSAISTNSALMVDKGYRTIGEMLWLERTTASPDSGSSRNKGGTYEKCVLHSQIVDEVTALFDAQRALGNQKATKEFEEDYLACLSWEKQTLDHDDRIYQEQVGTCTYFSEEKRAANACLSSELLRAYERLKHLVIIDENGTESRLSNDKVSKYIGILFSTKPIRGNKACKVTYSTIAKDLDLPSRSTFKGVDPSRLKTEEPFAPRVWRSMRNNELPEDLLVRMLEDHALADGIGEALAYASTEASLRLRLEVLPLSESEKNALCALPFNSRVYKGYGSRSLKAIEMLLEALGSSEIQTLSEAEEATGLANYRRSDRIERGQLLPPYTTYDPACTNPTVLRAMSRMRRIVNAIIRIYGVPDEIHIELGGELKHSSKERDRIRKKNSKNRVRNERLAQTAAEYLEVDPSEVPSRLIRKLALLEEQKSMDIYTGEAIKLERLLDDDRYAEIDHILPYSRTCDDSRNNKVLVLAKSNQDKRERTPFEWMTSGEPTAPSWNDFKERVFTNPNLSRKRRYLLNENLDSDAQREFLNRNLNDTRYMSRAAKQWLEEALEYPDRGRKQHVVAVAGGATAVLRHSWGLNFGAGNTKDRDDNRHHAVDAAVIAACSQGSIQLVAKASSRERAATRRKLEGRLPDTQPWPTFADDVIARREAVIPTRMVSHGVTGRAFEDMAYGFEGVTHDERGYSIVHRQGKVSKKGNIVIDKTGSVRIVDGMAFLRLWLDPEASAGSNARGKYYAEPVYYADIPAIANGSYIPRAIEVKIARTSWKPVPQQALKNRPLILFRGDVLSVNGKCARYWSIDINSRKLDMRDLHTGQSVSGFPSIASWRHDTQIKIIEEDCLGHCYQQSED